MLFPALHNLIAKWAPPDEKGKFVAALLGGALGTVVTWPVASLLMEALGWHSVFYATAAFTLIMGIVWFGLVSDTPANHPRISDAEREHIEKSLGDVISKENVQPPYFKIMTSLPFLALLLLHYGNIWGLYFLLNEAPTFMKDVLKFDLTKAGFLASLPSLARLVLGFGFGSLGDALRRNNVMSLTFMRKFFCIFCRILKTFLVICLLAFGHVKYLLQLISFRGYF